jgi:hypothetical protein
MIEIPDEIVELGASKIYEHGYLKRGRHENAVQKAAHGALIDEVRLIEACGGSVSWEDTLNED